MALEEKAKELVDKYVEQLLDVGLYRGDVLSDAKQCALICLDEKSETLLSVIGSLPYMYSEHELSLHRELQELKKEIEKL